MMRKKLVKKTLEKVKQSYSLIAGQFDQTRRLPWKEFSLFLPYLKKGMRVLDLGCGNGRFYEYIQKREIDYTGIDHSEEFIQIARSRYPLGHFEVGDMTDPALLEHAEGYDVLFCIAAFHHLPSRKLREKILHQFHRLLKKEGVLIMTVWQLRQKKYRVAWIRSLLSFMFHFGLKYDWNDLWIRWGDSAKKRYYHAFSPHEIQQLFKGTEWRLEEFYGTCKGARSPFKEAHNLCIVARKI